MQDLRLPVQGSRRNGRFGATAFATPDRGWSSALPGLNDSYRLLLSCRTPWRTATGQPWASRMPDLRCMAKAAINNPGGEPDEHDHPDTQHPPDRGPPVEPDRPALLVRPRP